MSHLSGYVAVSSDNVTLCESGETYGQIKHQSKAVLNNMLVYVHVKDKGWTFY